ncbi:MAG: hypothetical protein Q9227_000770 [Pyrenula ochraceoflavens]
MPAEKEKVRTPPIATNELAISNLTNPPQVSVAESLIRVRTPINQCSKRHAKASHLQANPKLTTQPDLDSRLPIHWACSSNTLPLLSHLVTLPKFDPDVQDSSGWTPLMISSSLLPSGSGLEAATLLLSRSADVNLPSNSGQTALFFACSKNALDVARLLIAHRASTRTRDKRGQLPIMRAAAIGSVPLVQLLLANKSPINASDVDGLTALHHAVSEGHGDVAVALLKAGAETDRRDSEERLAIDLAPDTKVRVAALEGGFEMRLTRAQVKKYIISEAEKEGIDL